MQLSSEEMWVREEAKRGEDGVPEPRGMTVLAKPHVSTACWGQDHENPHHHEQQAAWVRPPTPGHGSVGTFASMSPKPAQERLGRGVGLVPATAWDGGCLQTGRP